MDPIEVKDLPLVEDKLKLFSYILYWAVIGVFIVFFIIDITVLTFTKPIDNSSDSVQVVTEKNDELSTEPVRKNNSTQDTNNDLTNNQNETNQHLESNNGKTLTDLIVKPIAESPRFQVIFKYLFYLLLWLLIWLLVPSAFQRLKRFKFFNMEFELDTKQNEVISIIDQQMKKFKFLTYLMKDENKEVLRSSFDSNHPKYKDALEFSLSKMQTFYISEWDEHFTFEVLTLDEFKQKKFPNVLNKSLDIVEKYKIGIPINKENQEKISQKNFLIYRINEIENVYTNKAQMVEYIIVISSYRTIFDENDGYLLAGITSLVSELHKRAWENLGLNKLKKKIKPKVTSR